MDKFELIKLLQDPDVRDTIQESLFGKPVKTPDSYEVVVATLGGTINLIGDMLMEAKQADGANHHGAAVVAPLPPHVQDALRASNGSANRSSGRAIESAPAKPSNLKLPVARIAWERVPSWISSIMINPTGEVWGCSRAIDPNFKRPIAGKYTMLCHDYRGYSDVLLLNDCELPLILDRGRDRARGGVQVFMLTPKNLDKHVSRVGPPEIKGPIPAPQAERVTDKIVCYPERDVIPWDVIDPCMKFAFRDPAGYVFVTTDQPVRVDFGWNCAKGDCVRISRVLKGLALGACPWHQSLQERPNA